MSAFDKLPVILVSAINETVATALMSDLIDNDVTDDYTKDEKSLDRVWRLVNKYYTANVRVHPLGDQGQLQVDPASVEAHVIHLTEEEAGSPAAALRAAASRARAGVWRGAAVRLLLPDSAAAGALAGWAAAQRAAVLPRREAGARDEARAALQAHVWRGLVRTDRAPAPPPDAGASGEDADSDAPDWDEDAEELRAVERAEAFAAALGALGPALAERPGLLAGPGPHAEAGPRGPAERRERAEVLVQAFCRALGLDLDSC